MSNKAIQNTSKRKLFSIQSSRFPKQQCFLLRPSVLPVAATCKCRPLRPLVPTTEAQVQSQVSPCDVCSGQGDTMTGFSLSTFHKSDILIFIYT